MLTKNAYFRDKNKWMPFLLFCAYVWCIIENTFFVYLRNLWAVSKLCRRKNIFPKHLTETTQKCTFGFESVLTNWRWFSGPSVSRNNWNWLHKTIHRRHHVHSRNYGNNWRRKEKEKENQKDNYFLGMVYLHILFKVLTEDNNDEVVVSCHSSG